MNWNDVKDAVAFKVVDADVEIFEERSLPERQFFGSHWKPLLYVPKRS